MPVIHQPVRHIIPISGKDSLCTALVQRARESNLPYEYIFCDVGMELPETYAWLDKVENYLGTRLIRIGKNLEEVIAEKGMLPSHQRRFCTMYGKIFPIRDYLRGSRAIQYVGIRADEAERSLGSFGDDGVTAKYPLIETGVNLPMVYAILDKAGLSPPDFFWQRLWDEVWAAAGPASQRYMTELKPWTRSHLFSGRSRSNCYSCFYQRLYEWVWLREVHPDLFAEAKRIEFEWGSKQGPNRALLQQDFNWRQDGPLSVIESRAEEIFRKRVSKVRWAVVKMRHLPQDEEIDLLSMTSCGMYCGK